MLGLSRFARLFLLVTVLVLLPTLYLLYPSLAAPRSPEDEVFEYESGGIDSTHWRAPIKPDFEQEELRDWSDACVAGEDCGAAQEQVGEQGVGQVSLEKDREVGAGEDMVLGGGVIMPKFENATAKAELGRAAWKVLHLMTLRFPDEPTSDDRTALRSYFYLFARLYPCGECAAEFQALLKEYPPQVRPNPLFTSSRKSASLWLCYVHNLINLRLGKEEFDCLTLDATYDCGCGDEAVSSGGVAAQRGLDGVSTLNDSSSVGILNKDELGKELHRDEPDESTGDRRTTLYRRLSRRR
ncbi:MAG: hypothetical protein TREMPRED_005498 [Tremellales sp. Tagirdzhanova-0007]|nr:MAG: hypothetical protein TREMPRED_005498 [Tremellales sp. Tagirdzhanova-0007]